MTLTNLASLLLTVKDREAVLGDLQEANEGPLQSVRQIFSLALRRQLEFWKNWRPWLAAFGLTMPNSFALMGISVSISWASLHFLKPGITIGSNPAVRNGLFPFLCQLSLLLICSWVGGFVVGSLSRSTVWASVMLCVSPLLFCLSRFRIQSLSKYSLFLFLPPAILGVHRGLQRLPIKMHFAILLAGIASISIICLWSNSHPLLLDCSLIWPAWYVVATSKPSTQI